MNISWCYDQSKTNWRELSEMYKIAPLGTKLPSDLEVVFSNSRFKCFVFDSSKLIGVGRALADGLDCSYICDIAIHPDYQGRGIGSELIRQVLADAGTAGLPVRLQVLKVNFDSLGEESFITSPLSPSLGPIPTLSNGPVRDSRTAGPWSTKIARRFAPERGERNSLHREPRRGGTTSVAGRIPLVAQPTSVACKHEKPAKKNELFSYLRMSRWS